MKIWFLPIGSTVAVLREVGGQWTHRPTIEHETDGHTAKIYRVRLCNLQNEETQKTHQKWSPDWDGKKNQILATERPNKHTEHFTQQHKGDQYNRAEMEERDGVSKNNIINMSNTWQLIKTTIYRQNGHNKVICRRKTEQMTFANATTKLKIEKLYLPKHHGENIFGVRQAFASTQTWLPPIEKC